MSQREMAARAGSGAMVTATDRWLALDGLVAPMVFIAPHKADSHRPGRSGLRARRLAAA
jgi:hypothetical protein